MTLRHALPAALLLGVAGWLLVWFQTEPRANFDSLIYHTHALEYAGLDREEADAVSWRIFARYATEREHTVVAETIGGTWSTPADGRWMDLYQMRPLYPLLVAAAYPAVGERAPMTVSAAVTIGFVVTTALGFGLLFGWRAAGFATVAALLQVHFTQWLVFLATDGLAMTMWAVTLLAVAFHARSGRWAWLAVIGLAVLALGLTRPTSSLAPMVPAVCAGAAFVVRKPVWRRFGVATVAAVVPAAAVIMVQSLLGYPGLSDVLQEMPTRHFALPDVENPVGYTIRVLQWAIPHRLLPTLLEQPLLLATVAAGIAGLALHRSWTGAVFLAGLVVVPAAWVIHPVWFDTGRILAPAWVSLSLGVGLFAEWLLVAARQPIGHAVSWATRPTRVRPFEIPVARPETDAIPVRAPRTTGVAWHAATAPDRLPKAPEVEA